MITRTKLAMMKEKELQQDVLVPLFEAWGFHDVEVHQGTTEVGKDLVMWKSGDLEERLNYAVVVKAKQISGQINPDQAKLVVLPSEINPPELSYRSNRWTAQILS